MNHSTFNLQVLLISLVGTACMVGFHRPAGAVDIDWVAVGNPGNPADTFNETYGRAWGGVNYNFRIGKYEVTNAQYAEFLNAKATVGDTLELYNAEMSSSALGGILRTGNGTASDPFDYDITNGRGNNPVVFVSWYDALRFANWSNNGQGNGDTESGSYTLLGGTPVPSNAFPTFPSIARNPGSPRRTAQRGRMVQGRLSQERRRNGKLLGLPHCHGRRTVLRPAPRIGCADTIQHRESNIQ
jgi:hypothetical protein